MALRLRSCPQNRLRVSVEGFWKLIHAAVDAQAGPNLTIPGLVRLETLRVLYRQAVQCLPAGAPAKDMAEGHVFTPRSARGLYRLCEQDDTWRYATSADPTVTASTPVVPNSTHIPVWLNLATAGRVASTGGHISPLQLRLGQALASAVEGAPSGDLAVRILKLVQTEAGEQVGGTTVRSGPETSVPHVPLVLSQLQLLELRHALQCGTGTGEAVQSASAVWLTVVPALRHAVEAPWNAFGSPEKPRGNHVPDQGADRASVLLGLAHMVSTLPEQTGSEFAAALSSDVRDLLPRWPSALPFQARSLVVDVTPYAWKSGKNPNTWTGIDVRLW